MKRDESESIADARAFTELVSQSETHEFEEDGREEKDESGRGREKNEGEEENEVEAPKFGFPRSVAS